MVQRKRTALHGPNGLVRTPARTDEQKHKEAAYASDSASPYGPRHERKDHL